MVQTCVRRNGSWRILLQAEKDREMTYEEYVVGVGEFLKDYLPEFIPEEAIRVVPVVQDGRMRHGLRILFPDEGKAYGWQPLGMLINLQDCYQRVQQLSLGQAIKATGEIVVETLKRQNSSRVRDITRILSDFAAAKEHLCMELRNVRQEPEDSVENICRQIPGTSDLMLAVNLRLLLPDGIEGNLEVRKSDLEKWGVSEEDAVHAAYKNGRDRYGIKMQRLEGIPAGKETGGEVPGQCAVPDSPFWVTDRNNFRGAAALFYPGVLENIGKEIGDFSFLALTVNEVAVVPVAFERRKEPELLRRSLQELLALLHGEQPLSKNIYCYENQKHRIVSLDEYRRSRQKEMQKRFEQYPEQKRQNPRL